MLKEYIIYNICKNSTVNHIKVGLQFLGLTLDYEIGPSVSKLKILLVHFEC